ncbi:hypothetical protein F2Q70_00029200 [Brassica cretica]|uniref:Uncharacterized protein n=1 Tax=Brassica cretica TaxID=69181 RepID=A0A8S9FCJ2_BRACR|nr:hypothetical protein F2Q70_00029200 [Brassica cretica]
MAPKSCLIGNQRIHHSLQPGPISRRRNRRSGTLRHGSDSSYPRGRGNKKANPRKPNKLRGSIYLRGLRRTRRRAKENVTLIRGIDGERARNRERRRKGKSYKEEAVGRIPEEAAYLLTSGF